MIACLCRGVSDSEVRSAIAEGARTVADIRRACGAGADCGSCCVTLAAMVRQAERKPFHDSIAPQFALAAEAR